MRAKILLTAIHKSHCDTIEVWRQILGHTSIIWLVFSVRSVPKGNPSIHIPIHTFVGSMAHLVGGFSMAFVALSSHSISSWMFAFVSVLVSMPELMACTVLSMMKMIQKQSKNKKKRLCGVLRFTKR